MSPTRPSNPRNKGPFELGLRAPISQLQPPPSFDGRDDPPAPLSAMASCAPPALDVVLPPALDVVLPPALDVVLPPALDVVLPLVAAAPPVPKLPRAWGSSKNPPASPSPPPPPKSASSHTWNSGAEHLLPSLSSAASVMPGGWLQFVALLVHVAGQSASVVQTIWFGRQDPY